jgi:multicomponent Na+:H+ antiporter subunit E
MRSSLQDSQSTVATRGREAVRLAVIWCVLFAFWLLLSGYFTPFLVAAGAGCSLAALWLGQRMEVTDREGIPVDLSIRIAVAYWPWLFKEIVKSAWDVSRAILRPTLAVSPTLVRFRASQASDLALVIHANSITLTPGTICVAINGREFLVHALLQSAAASVGTGSEMDRRVAALEKRP